MRLIDRESLKVIDEELSADGVACVFGQWKAVDGGGYSKSRINFYLSWIRIHLDRLKERHPSITSIPLIISGMASSNIGMKELPYAALPFPATGQRATAYYIAPTDEFPHSVVLLSGVKGGDEVMRGEEAQLVGIAREVSAFAKQQRTVVLLPGTHSKHVHVCQHEIIQIETYITGELFAIASQNGLLKEAVQDPGPVFNDEDWKMFLNGVAYSGETTLLQSLFKIRTNQLFEKFTRTQNHTYLSGLLIGYELRSLLDKSYDQLVLCCETKLFEFYKRAMTYLDLHTGTDFVLPCEAETATIRGQLIIANQYLGLPAIP